MHTYSLRALSLLTLGCCGSAGMYGQRTPNIVLILADDLGYGDVSAYGARTIATPNIDGLARGGICFTNGHASSATSTPSRYALLTGMYPWRRRANILPGDAPLIIGEEQETLPKMLRRAGYRTAAIGKWHLGMGRGRINWNELIAPGAREVGFDYSCILSATVDRVPTVYVENGRVLGLDPSDPIEVSYQKPFDGEPTARTNPELMTRMRYSHGHDQTVVNGIPRIGYMRGGKSAVWKDDEMADFLVGKVREYIDTVAKDRPFFLYYGLHEPHVPRVPANRFVGASGMGPRGDAIVEADWCVGEVVKALEKEGLLDNTLVIFTSDNGPVLDDGYADEAPELAARAGHDMNGGLRGGKYSLFEAGTRVPFFVYWRGSVAPQRSDALFSQHDLFASLAALVHQTVPEGLDSENHLGALLGRSGKARKAMIVEASGRLALRYGRYALVPPYRGAKKNATGNELGVVDHYALYDLEADPAQQHEVTENHPRLVRKLRKQFLKLVGDYYQEEKQQEALQ